MSTITRTWQEQERLRIEKEKENERKRLEQERERARIEQQKEAERKRVESERAQREKERIASLRAAAATKPSTTTRPTPTTSTMQTTSLLPLPSPHAPLGPTTKLTIQPTAISSRITNTIRVSVIPIDPGPSTSSLPGVVACGQSGYFNCAPEYGGGCCPVGFACGKGELCVSPQLEKDKPLESLPCPGYRGYFACKEDIGGGCCPANYACIKDSRSQCRLSDSNLVFTNVDRLATRIPVPTSALETNKTAPTGDPSSSPDDQRHWVGSPGEAAGVIVGGIMILVAYFLGCWLFSVYRQRRNGFRLRKSFRVLEVRSQWRDAKARARNELPSHHGVSELAVSTSRSASPLPPRPQTAPPLTLMVEMTREGQLMSPPFPPTPLQLPPITPVTALPISPPSATVSTVAPTLASPVSTMTATTADLPPLLPPPSIPLPPTPTKKSTSKGKQTEKGKMPEMRENASKREAELETGQSPGCSAGHG